MKDILHEFGLMIFRADINKGNCSKRTTDISGAIVTTGINQPALIGRLIFHNCAIFCNDPKLYISGFSTCILAQIMQTGIDNSMTSSLLENKTLWKLF